MSRQERTALHQGNGVRVHLIDGIPVVIGQTADAMLYMKLVFSYDGCVRSPQQVIVVQQTSRDGILDGNQSYHRGITLDILENLFESGATNRLDLFFREILMGCYIVERAPESLDGNSLHFVFSMENPAPNYMKRDLFSFFILP